MAHINFLEHKGFTQQKLTLNYLVMVCLVGGILVCSMTYSLIQKIRLNTLQNRLAATISHSAQLREIKKAVPAAADVPSDFFAPLHDRTQWAPLFMDISRHMTPAVWLTSITGHAGSGQPIDMEGRGTDVQAIVRLQSQLEQIAAFKKVVLVSSAPDTASDSHDSQFKIQCWLQ